MPFDLLISNTKTGEVITTNYENVICAIGGDLGSRQKYKKSTNMTYKNYSLHERLFLPASSEIQEHPFGLVDNKNNPRLCIPQSVAIHGKIRSLDGINIRNVRDIGSRSNICKWIRKYGGTALLEIRILDIDKAMTKRFIKYNESSSDRFVRFRIEPCPHYLLKVDKNQIRDELILVGECASNTFRGDRPAGMGITQAIISGAKSASKIR